MISDERIKEIEDIYRRRPMIKEILAEREQLVEIAETAKEVIETYMMMGGTKERLVNALEAWQKERGE